MVVCFELLFNIPVNNFSVMLLVLTTTTWNNCDLLNDTALPWGSNLVPLESVSDLFHQTTVLPLGHHTSL